MRVVARSGQAQSAYGQTGGAEQAGDAGTAVLLVAMQVVHQVMHLGLQVLEDGVHIVFVGQRGGVAAQSLEQQC